MFNTPYVQINENGIDLLKNQSISKHIDYKIIDNVTFKKGYQLNNWVFVFILGIVISFCMIIWEIEILTNFSINPGIQDLSNKIYWILFIFPLIFLVLGISLIITSLKKCPKLIIKINDNSFEISIKELESENKIDELIEYLKNKTCKSDKK